MEIRCVDILAHLGGGQSPNYSESPRCTHKSLLRDSWHFVPWMFTEPILGRSNETADLFSRREITCSVRGSRRVALARRKNGMGR
jgi:hypothetical protein